MRSYFISVCPICEDGPLVFDPVGLDAREGMNPRAECRNGHMVIRGDERRLDVVERLSMCSCGTPDAFRCPLHVNPRS